MVQQAGAAPALVASGWRDAGLFIWALAALAILYAIGNEHGAHPIPVVLIAMVFTSAVLITGGGGPGPDAIAIMTAPQSFLVGMSTIGLELFYVPAMYFASPTETALLIRIAVPISLLAGWLILGRKPGGLAVAGALIVLGALSWLLSGLPPEARWSAFFFSTASALCFVSRSLSSEVHPWNRRATTVRERARVTGLVVLTTTILCYVLVAIAIGAVAAGLVSPTSLVPRPDQFAHVPTVLVAVAVGGLVLSSMYFLSFSAVVKIRTENFIAVTVLAPVTTLILQYLAVALGIIRPVKISTELLVCLAVIVVAAMMIVVEARQRQRRMAR